MAKRPLKIDAKQLVFIAVSGVVLVVLLAVLWLQVQRFMRLSVGAAGSGLPERMTAGEPKFGNATSFAVMTSKPPMPPSQAVSPAVSTPVAGKKEPARPRKRHELYIQTGAFSKQDSAAAMERRLASMGLRTVTTGDGVRKVLVVVDGGEKEAKETLKKLSDAGIQAFRVKR